MANSVMSVPFMYPITQQQALQQPTFFTQPNPFLQATCIVPVQVPLDPQQQIQQQHQAQLQLANHLRGQQLQLQLQQRAQQDLQHNIFKQQQKEQVRFQIQQELDQNDFEGLRQRRTSSRPLTVYPLPPVQSRSRYHGRNPSIGSTHSSRSQHAIYSPSTSQAQSMQGSPRTSSALSGHGFPDMQRLSLASRASSQSLRPSHSLRRPSVAPFTCPLPEKCNKGHSVRTAHGTNIPVNRTTFALNTGLVPSRHFAHETPTHASCKPDVDMKRVDAATLSFVSHLALAVWHQSLPGASRRDPAIKDVDSRLVAAALDLWLVTERQFAFRFKFDPVGCTVDDEDRGKGRGAKFFFQLGDSKLRWDVESFAETGKARLEREMFAPKSTMKEWIQWPIVGLAAGGKSGPGPKKSGDGPIKLQPTLFKRTFIFLEAVEDFGRVISNHPPSGSFRLVDTSLQELARIWSYWPLDQVRSSGRFLGCMQCDNSTRCAVVRHPQTADWVCSGCWQYADPNRPQELEWSRKESAWRCDPSCISFPSKIECGCLAHQRARLQSIECKVAAKNQKLQRLRSAEALSNRKDTQPQRLTPIERHEKPSVRFDERVKQMDQRSDRPLSASVKQTQAVKQTRAVKEAPTVKKRPSLHRWPRSMLSFKAMKTTVEEEESDTGSSGATSVDATFGSNDSKQSTPPSSRTSSFGDAIPRP